MFSGRLASIVRQYLTKGSKVYIEGSLHTKCWAGKDGQERTEMEIVADELIMLGHKPKR